MRSFSPLWLGFFLVLASCASSGRSSDEYVRWWLDEDRQHAAHMAVSVADIDGALRQLASTESDPLILLPNKLDRTKLDYSLNSLNEIDDWLGAMHTINRLQAGEGNAGEYLVMDVRGENSVTLAGLYLGEVIRANSELDWRWERFDLFLKANPYFAEHYGDKAELDVFVLVGPQGVATPINTALKRVVQGREESLFYIGSLLSEEIDMRQAVSGYDFMGLDRRDSIPGLD